jgi:hypothetical protein
MNNLPYDYITIESKPNFGPDLMSLCQDNEQIDLQHAKPLKPVAKSKSQNIKSSVYE